MPFYSMRDVNTNEVTVICMTISEREEYLKTNPHMRQELSTPSIGDSIRLRVRKSPDTFKDVLRNIKAHHHGSVIDV